MTNLSEGNKHEISKEGNVYNNNNKSKENLNNISFELKSGIITPTRFNYLVEYVISLAGIESKYITLKNKEKNEIRSFISNSIKDTLPTHLKEYSLSSYDTDSSKIIDSTEEENYVKSMKEALLQILAFGGFNKFEKIHLDSIDKSGVSNVDKYLADKANLQGYIYGDHPSKNFSDILTLKAKSMSESEMHHMHNAKFNPTSSKSWNELGILMVKEFGNGVEDALRFLSNIPSGIILIPRYLKYRTDSFSMNIKDKTTAEIKIKELVEQNPSLGFLELFGEKGIDMFKKIGDMLVSGKQGDIAMLMLFIAGLVAMGAGATKAGLNFARKTSVGHARFVGKQARLAGETINKSTRTKLKTVSKKLGKIQKTAEKIDDITSGVGLGAASGYVKIGHGIDLHKINENLPKTDKVKMGKKFTIESLPTLSPEKLAFIFVNTLPVEMQPRRSDDEEFVYNEYENRIRSGELTAYDALKALNDYYEKGYGPGLTINLGGKYIEL